MSGVQGPGHVPSMSLGHNVRARVATPLHMAPPLWQLCNCGSCGDEVGRPTISPSLFRGPSPLPFVSRSQHVRRVEGRSPRRNFRLQGLHRGRQRACDSAQGSVLGYPRVVGREPLVVAHSKKGDRGLQVIHVGSGCIDFPRGVQDGTPRGPGRIFVPGTFAARALRGAGGNELAGSGARMRTATNRTYHPREFQVSRPEFFY